MNLLNFRSMTGSEDCLYLNIFTRAKSPLSGLPVLVWIHGGAFNFGSGSGAIFTSCASFKHLGPQSTVPEAVFLVVSDPSMNEL
jgi:carboxylesterase type B